MLVKINIRTDMDIMPASINIETGVMSINQDIFNLPIGCRIFVLLHEYYHLQADTYSEFKADLLALKKLVELGYSPDFALQALKNLLPFDDYEDRARVSALQKFITKNYVHSNRL
jgi:hypothetical protein